MILGPEDQRRAVDDSAGHGLEHGSLALGLRTVVVGRRILVGTEHGDVREVGDAGAARGLGNGARAEDVHRIETLAATLVGNRDEVHHRVGVHDGAIDRPAVAEVRLHRLDPADKTERLEMAGEIGTADGGADAPAALQERADDVATEEARTAEDGDQTLVGGGDRHARTPRTPRRARPVSGY